MPNQLRIKENIPLSHIANNTCNYIKYSLNNYSALTVKRSQAKEQHSSRSLSWVSGGSRTSYGIQVSTSLETNSVIYQQKLLIYCELRLETWVWLKILLSERW